MDQHVRTRNHAEDSAEEQINKLVKEYLPFLKALDEKGIGYCLVGGTAVAIQSLLYGNLPIRKTMDADLLIEATS